MMDNKLSEMSKPVAYDYQIASACIADGHNENGKWVDWDNKLSRYCPPDWMMEEGKVTGLKLLYSQEYVSALLAELEDERASRAQWQRNCTRAEECIAELEVKLATPVRLPEKDDLRLAGDASTKVVIKFRNSAIDECAKALRASGFTVEGDE